MGISRVGARFCILTGGGDFPRVSARAIPGGRAKGSSVFGSSHLKEECFSYAEQICLSAT